LMTLRIAVPQDKLSEFCKRNHIKKLSLFGGWPTF
jgi:hypothetical protein